MSRSLVPLFLLILLVSLDQISKFIVVELGLEFYRNYGFFFGLINFTNPVFPVLLISSMVLFIIVLIVRIHLKIILRPSGARGEVLNVSSRLGSNNNNGYFTCFHVRLFGRHVQDYVWVGSILFLAGSVSNLLDRFGRGYVVDFLDWKTLLSFWPTGFVRFFNLADVFIVAGLLIIGIRFTRRCQKAENRRRT